MPVTGVGGGVSRLAGPIAGTVANATLFTATLPTILRDLKVCNTGASTTVTLAINGSAVANQVIAAASVAASSLVTFALDIPLNPADTVQVLVGAASVVFTLTGEVKGGRL